MPKGKVEIIEKLPTPILNTEIQIVKVEDITTQTKSYPSIRVQFKDVKNNYYALMLWKQPSLSIATKLGAFCYAFHGKKFLENGEYDTDTWLGKWVKILKLERGSNLVEVVSAPKGFDNTLSKSEEGVSI